METPCGGIAQKSNGIGEVTPSNSRRVLHRALSDVTKAGSPQGARCRLHETAT